MEAFTLVSITVVSVLFIIALVARIVFIIMEEHISF